MDLEHISNTLVVWFSQHKRDLPWRRTYDPYHVWISEIMLQQTQMDRVVGYFTNWMELFPTIGSVAAAQQTTILKAWEGLGYYTRARNIHKTAAIIMKRHGGQLPSTREQLLALPGIGPYTAAAILSIAFGQSIPVIDANVERVLARLFDIDTPIKLKPARTRLEQLMEGLLTCQDPRILNQALMEFGALQCTPASPDCGGCPLVSHCRAHRIDAVGERPMSQRRQRTIPITMACGILYHRDMVYIQQRLDDDVWGGLWEFPGGRIKKGEDPRQAMIREMQEETGFRIKDISYFTRVIHHYTRYKVTLHAFFCSLDQHSTIPTLEAAQDYAWVRPTELSAYAFPAGHRQLIQARDRWPLAGQHTPVPIQ